MDISGETLTPTNMMDLSGNVIYTTSQSVSEPAPVVEQTVIRLEDILSSQEVLKSQEANDKVLLDGIASLPLELLRSRLIQWAAGGFQNAYNIHEIPMRAPSLCSDGQSRSLQDYIEFVSGKTINQHVAALQERMQDIVVSFANSGNSILIVVSKAETS